MRTVNVPRDLRSKRVLAVAAIVLLVIGGVGLGYSLSSPRHQFKAGAVREYTLDIVPKDIDLGNGAVGHAWTYNGTVPGPTLRVKVGERLRVRVRNRHTLTHSFHAHLSGFFFEYDSSEANLVSGAEHVYEYRPTVPGVYYYHTHFADKESACAQAEGQGPYGVIFVEDPAEPVLRNEVLVMREMRFHTEGTAVRFIMRA